MGAHRFARGRKRRTRTSACGWALSHNTVGKWRRRFVEHRMARFYDEPRPGAPRQMGDDGVAEVVRQTLEATPRDATHGACAQWRKQPGRAFDPAHVEGFQPAASPHRGANSQPILCFVEKVRDIVGLYLSPPRTSRGSLRRRKEPGAGPTSAAASQTQDSNTSRCRASRPGVEVDCRQRLQPAQPCSGRCGQIKDAPEPTK